MSSFLQGIPSDCNLMVVLGPTACGKTHFAVELASRLDAEIISADSRQVYRGMDLGTGKDLSEYRLADGKTVPYHLIDICEAGEKYNLYEYCRDFIRVYKEIRSRGKMPILCGGTGLYIEAVLGSYTLVNVPENPELRASLQGKNLDELTRILYECKQRRGDRMHNVSDVDTEKRAVRAIEIESYYEEHPEEAERSRAEYPHLHPYIIGLEVERDIRRERISRRLRQRLDEGMLNEVRGLLERGVQAEDLLYYGLEYKYLTMHLTGQLSYEEMFRQLETAIHQFAKRQMTWFRGMERRGYTIHWLNPALCQEDFFRSLTEA